MVFSVAVGYIKHPVMTCITFGSCFAFSISAATNWWLRFSPVAAKTSTHMVGRYAVYEQVWRESQ